MSVKAYFAIALTLLSLVECRPIPQSNDVEVSQESATPMFQIESGPRIDDDVSTNVDDSSVANSQDSEGNTPDESVASDAEVLAVDPEESRSSNEWDTFLSDCLSLHNRIRAQKHVPALVWDQRVAQSAQSSANYIASRPSLRLQHNIPDLRAANLGENLARGYPSCPSAIVTLCSYQ